MMVKSDNHALLRNSQLWLVSAALFLSMVGFGLTLPALPFFVERLALGPDATASEVALQVGLLTSAYALSQLVLGPLFGVLSDRWGRRPFLIFGLVGFAVGQAWFGLSTSLPALYAARFVAGAAAASLLTVASAVVVDVLDQSERVRGMAWKGTAASLGVVVGPAMSGLLSRTDMHGHRMIGRFMLDGFSIPFLAAAGIAILAVPPLLLWLEESAPHSSDSPSLAPDRTPLLDLLALSAVAQLALASFEAIFALYARNELSLGLSEIGWAFVTCGGVMALFQGVLVGTLGARIDLRYQLAAGFALLGAGLGSLGYVDTLTGALAAISVLAAGMAVVTPNLTVAISARRPGAPGTAIGLQYTAIGAGQVAGPIIGSLLFTQNARLPFVVMSGLCMVVAGVVWADRRVRPN